MKFKIFLLIFIFLVMGIIPVISMGNTSVKSQDKENNLQNMTENTTQNTENNENKQSKNSVLEGLLYARYSEDFNVEALKAFAVLFNSNLKKDENFFNLEDKKIYISDIELKEKFPEKSPNIIKTIKEIINETEQIYIYNNNEIAFVPYSECSSGFTYTDEKYENLISIASPWDKFSKNYNKDIKCIGVSIEGIKFLTNYYDYKTALMWYLPKYEIK